MKDRIVQKYSEELTKLGIHHEVFEHPQLISVEKVQKYLGYGMDDSAATLVMKAGDRFVAIIRRGDTKLDSEKVKKLLNVTTLRMATEEEFSDVTGVPSGAASVYIPNIPTFIDKRIFEKQYINAGSGSLLYTIRYKAEDLKKIPGITVVNVTNADNALTPVEKLEVPKGKRLYSAITPSGDGTLHIGNYLGAVRQFIELAKYNECFFQLATIHGLTTIQDQKQLAGNIERLTLNELALLGENPNIYFCYQSDIPYHTELQSILNNVTPLGLLKRAHAYKDKLGKDVMEDDINVGLFSYPMLMAADILIYKATLVPVGRDQKQHVEITRDIAERFNRIYKKKVFPLPDPYIPEEVAVILGTDGQRKMSKTLGNIISIFEDEEVIRKQVNGTFTDPTRKHVTDPGHVEGNMVFTYLDFFGEKEKVSELKELYKAGKVSDVEVKKYLFEALMKTFAPARARYADLVANPEKVKKILDRGRGHALEVASKTMAEVREAVGFTNRYSLGQPSTQVTGNSKITIDDFAKVDVRVGKVEAAENVEKSEKLIRLHVDFGSGGKRIIFTGVRQFGYTAEYFTGKQFFFVFNLEPRKMMGEESQGMIVAVDGSQKPIFLSGEGMPLGARIR